MEAAAGAPLLHGATLPPGMTGPQARPAAVTVAGTYMRCLCSQQRSALHALPCSPGRHAASSSASPQAMCSSRAACQTRTASCAQLVRAIMDEAAGANLNLVRAWAHASSPEYALQPSPGRFSEPVFRGLDYALDQARQRGLKVSAIVSSVVICTS